MSENAAPLFTTRARDRGPEMTGPAAAGRTLRPIEAATWLVDHRDGYVFGLSLALAVIAIGQNVHPGAWSAWSAVLVAVGAAAALLAQPIERRSAPTVVVFGADRVAARVEDAIREARRGASPALGQWWAAPRVRRVATWADVLQVAQTSRCSEVVFAGQGFPPTARLVDADGQRLSVRSGVEVIQQRLGQVPLDLIGEDGWFAQLGTTRSLAVVHALLKRGLDLLVAVCLGVGVIVLLPAIALAIRLDSPGPVFFTQARVGRGGRLFRIYKFRSMGQDAERNGTKWATVGDPRVTRVGKFMRLTRIDELPQLWNVLKGDMTLVGPRPEIAAYKGVLEEQVPHYMKRYAVTPGLTGWAQVRQGYASTIAEQRRKLEYDLYYIKHASLLLDLRILLETARVVLRKAGC